MAFEAFLGDRQVRPLRGRMVGYATSVGLHAPPVMLFVVALFTHELIIRVGPGTNVAAARAVTTMRVPVSLELGGAAREVPGAGRGAPGGPLDRGDRVASAPGMEGGSGPHVVVVHPAVLPVPSARATWPVLDAESAPGADDDSIGAGREEGPNEGIAAFIYGQGDLGAGVIGTADGPPGGEGDREGAGGDGSGPGIGDGTSGRPKGRGQAGLGSGADAATGNKLALASARSPAPAAVADVPVPERISQSDANYFRTHDAFPGFPDWYWKAGHHRYRLAVEICVTKEGAVDNVRTTQASSTPEIDALVINTIISRWRYRPRVLGGLPSAFCHPIGIVYEDKPAPY